jgi:hypothetical protein
MNDEFNPHILTVHGYAYMKDDYSKMKYSPSCPRCPSQVPPPRKHLQRIKFSIMVLSFISQTFLTMTFVEKRSVQEAGHSRLSLTGFR